LRYRLKLDSAVPVLCSFMSLLYKLS